MIKPGGVETLCTLFRDGMQQFDMDCSVDQAVKIARLSNEIGINYMELGFAGANSGTEERIKAVQAENLAIKILAFVRTRSPNKKVEDSLDLQAAVNLNVKHVTMVAKSRLLDVTNVLEAVPRENLAMIKDSAEFLHNHGIEALLDLEHGVDAFFGREGAGEPMTKKEAVKNRGYFLKVIETARRSGVKTIVICDTSGGSCPEEMTEMFSFLTQKYPDAKFGIHCHNDRGLAIANTRAAVLAGARHVQGVINGYGERCGNADLSSVIVNLQKFDKISLLKNEDLAPLKDLSKTICIAFGIEPDPRQPFFGKHAFATVAGIHASSEGKEGGEGLYFCCRPESVGNIAYFGVDKNSGVSNIKALAKTLGISLANKEAADIRRQYRKHMDAGKFYAEASFHLACEKAKGNFEPYFRVIRYKATGEIKRDVDSSGIYVDSDFDEAIVKIVIGKEVRHVAEDEAKGGFDAMVIAIKKALKEFYPQIENLRLQTYSVRGIGVRSAGSAATVRCLTGYQSEKDGLDFMTAGVSRKLRKADFKAVLEAFQYFLFITGAENKHQI